MINVSPDAAAGDLPDGELLALKRLLDDLINRTEAIEWKLEMTAPEAEEAGRLRDEKERLSREALEVMRRIDEIEDPED
ncbi:hypothetical protein [Haloferula sp. A504]|uniref:hypothetical protein n=1 Tax=Haloferula sp. A504 TaxID=3373601 RepID=UPI0031C42897|nr:hypothetical protein [Verrucomicrobiaceae bacterium E54]